MQPRDPTTGRYTPTNTDHDLLLAAISSRPSKHSALIEALYPTPTHDTSPSPVIEPDPEMRALAFR